MNETYSCKKCGRNNWIELMNKEVICLGCGEKLGAIRFTDLPELKVRSVIDES
jgi:hypothetical protein